MTKHLMLGAALAVLLSGAAQAQSRHGGLFSHVALTSDYRWAGASSSGRQPAPQLSIYWWRPDKLYAGVFATGVDFNDPGQTSVELDLYAGRHFDLDAKTRLTGEVMYTVFPDRQGGGPTYDFVQLKTKGQRTEGPVTLLGSVAYTPEASYHAGPATTVEAEAAWKLWPSLTLSAEAGRRWVERGTDRTYWNLGATATWRRLSFDLRYHDTDVESRAACLWSDACEPALVGTLTWNLEPIMFGGAPLRRP
jgi:uncharacterized protein (TIGR02001 family)